MNYELNKANFRIALTSSGLTQEQFAKRYRITQPFISMILSGRRTPSKRLEFIMRRFISIEFGKLKFVPITNEAS